MRNLKPSQHCRKISFLPVQFSPSEHGKMKNNRRPEHNTLRNIFPVIMMYLRTFRQKQIRNALGYDLTLSVWSVLDFALGLSAITNSVGQFSITNPRWEPGNAKQWSTWAAVMQGNGKMDGLYWNKSIIAKYAWMNIWVKTLALSGAVVNRALCVTFGQNFPFFPAHNPCPTG